MTGPRRFLDAVVVYFGGTGTEAPRDEPRESWLEVAVRVLPPVTVVLVLKSALDWGDGLLDWLKLLGVMLPVAVAWGATLRLFRRRTTKNAGDETR